MAHKGEKLTREDIAKLEIGRTSIHPAVAWLMVALFVAAVFSVPLAQHLYEFHLYRRGDRDSAVPQVYDLAESFPKAAAAFEEAEGNLIERIWAGNTVLLGDIADDQTGFERRLERSSLLQQTTLAPTQAFLTRWTGLGTERIYVGRDGYLFLRAGMDLLWGPPFLDADQLEKRSTKPNEWTPPAQPDPREAVVQFHRQLDQRGIVLVVMPTTVKGMIRPEKFSRRFEGADQPAQNVSLERFRREVVERTGKDAKTSPAIVFDPTPVLWEMKQEGRKVFLETDTHWTPQAMQRVAAELAKVIEPHVGPPTRPTRYVEEPVEITALGDAARALDLPEDQSIYGPETVTNRRIATDTGKRWSADATGNVLLLGDSFSNVYSLKEMGWGDAAGLAEQVSYELRCPLDRIVRNDNGAFATRQELRQQAIRQAQAGEDRLVGKKVVVWQFAARELAVGNWRTDLPLPAPPTKTAPAAEETEAEAEAAQGVLISGIIRDIARPPKRGIYVNRRRAFLLGDLAVFEGQLDASQVVGYAMSVRNRKFMPPARWRKGQRVTVRIRPWDDVRGEYDGIDVDQDLEDPDLILFSDLWWAELPKRQQEATTQEAGAPAEATQQLSYGWDALVVAVTAVAVAAVMLSTWHGTRQARREQRNGEAPLASDETSGGAER